MTERGSSDYTEDLREISDARGAMVCDYATFRSIYRLSARSAVREGVHSVIASITVTGSGDSDNVDLSNRIGAAISNALRRDDVVTGFDTTRHLILLGNLTARDAQNVLRRLVDRIVEDVGDAITVETEVRPLEAALNNL